ncbi:MAG: SDR family NAD(P)-dependent oxidoreductase [Gammaproteobacteria bacterium]
MKTELNNRVALVIGGTGVTGTAICKQLALSGARVVTNHQDDNIEEWQIKLAESGINITPIKADVTDFDECIRLVENIEETVGPIDIIVNSSELNEEVPFHKMEKSQWDTMLAENLDSVFNICRNLAERMSNRGFGRIINISSIISRMGQAGQSHQATAKAGLHGFTMALAQELAKKGVTVNTVSPGCIATTYGADQQLPNIPAGRPGNVDEVACLVDFLCSEQAGYINGADIAINGAQYTH